MKIQNSNQGLQKNSPDSSSVQTNQRNDRDVEKFKNTLTKNSDKKGQDTSQDQNLSSLFSQSKDPQPPAVESMNAGKPIESENQSSDKKQNFVQRLKQQGIEYFQKRGTENYKQGHYVAAGIDAIGEFLISDIPETVPGAVLGIATDLAVGKAVKLFGKGAKKLMQNIDKFNEPLQDKIKTIFKKVEADETLTKADNATISDALEELDGKKLENYSDFDRLKGTKRNRVDDVGPKTTTTDDVIELEPGKKGGWNKKLNKSLKPNTKYKVGSYTYETDDLGRVNRVSGKLDTRVRDRNTYQQLKAGKTGGIKDGIESDEGGHLIASIFNGPGEQINYAAMNGNLNKGAWRQLENKWNSALGEGKTVDVDIKQVFRGSSERPDRFMIKSTIDGVEEVSILRNIPGG